MTTATPPCLFRMYQPHTHFPKGTCLSPPSISSGIFFYPFMITKDCWYSRQRQIHSCVRKVGTSHPVRRRFHCGPWILSSHSHPDRTVSSSGLRKSSLLRKEIPSLLFKQRGQGAELHSSALHQHSPSAARCCNTYLLGQHHGPSAGCACLPVPQGGQSPHYGMRLCPERNENPGEAKTATQKQFQCEF